MPRGPRWTDAENNILLKLVERGMTAEDIYKSGLLPGRSLPAIQMQISRLRGASFVKQKKKFIVKQIREAEIVDLEAVVRRFVDAFNKVCDLTEYSKEDLERFRIIFSAARSYFDLYFRLEEFSEVKRRVERLERLVSQLAPEEEEEEAQQEA